MTHDENERLAAGLSHEAIIELMMDLAREKLKSDAKRDFRQLSDEEVEALLLVFSGPLGVVINTMFRAFDANTTEMEYGITYDNGSTVAPWPSKEEAVAQLSASVMVGLQPKLAMRPKMKWRAINPKEGE